MSADPANAASPLKPANDNQRHRATVAEMEVRANFLIGYAAIHAPVTVRQLYYAATVVGLPGIRKDDNGYDAVQRQVLNLRREGRMPYRHIADLTRFQRKPLTHNGISEALEETAIFYRRALWRDMDYHVEVWAEKDALAGSLTPITSKFDVPLMVCRGFTSETFAHEAVRQWEGIGKEVHVYHLGDFDRSGQDAASDLERKLKGFAAGSGLHVMFNRMAVNAEQVEEMGLPTREPKRVTAADKKWPYPFACELDAIPPDVLRKMLDDKLTQYIPEDQMQVLLAAEESEREILKIFARSAADL
ncbi:hypothetical protein OEG84_19700 [Hoeflea sp. G2-23]|uniref:Wadjet protein JetD C-terminal domain-containing protein n=1 Tax=Hoeflea algicola TaxID=2983763 RepID=A0ABT3ZDL5_9HYPH|nr:hypothetical protein [Hoeflea algicola]MCY0149863.1 hypothetical protein [Hoeflea algicola]